MLGDISGVKSIYIVTGYTDMRKSIDGLVTIIRHTFNQDPFSNALFLFCGRRCDRIKAIHYEKDGFVLLYKRLNHESGRFQWPRSSNEMKPLTRKQFSWLMDGLSIEQPTAIRISKNDGI